MGKAGTAEYLKPRRILSTGIRFSVAIAEPVSRPAFARVSTHVRVSLQRRCLQHIDVKHYQHLSYYPRLSTGAVAYIHRGNYPRRGSRVDRAKPGRYYIESRDFELLLRLGQLFRPVVAPPISQSRPRLLFSGSWH